MILNNHKLHFRFQRITLITPIKVMIISKLYIAISQIIANQTITFAIITVDAENNRLTIMKYLNIDYIQQISKNNKYNY